MKREEEGNDKSSCNILALHNGLALMRADRYGANCLHRSSPFSHTRRQWAAVEERYEAHPSKLALKSRPQTLIHCVYFRDVPRQPRVVPVTFIGTSGGLAEVFRTHGTLAVFINFMEHTPRMEANQVGHAMVSRPSEYVMRQPSSDH